MSLTTNNKIRIRRLTTNAILVALFVVFSTLLSFKTPFFEVSLASLPILLAAFYCGPVDALVVAAFGSFIEQAFSAYGLGVTTPVWMAPVILQAACAGLLFHFFCRNKNEKPWLLIAIILLSELVLTAANTAALCLDGVILQYPVEVFFLLLPTRLVNGGVRCVISCILLPLLLPVLTRNLPLGPTPSASVEQFQPQPEKDPFTDGVDEQESAPLVCSGCGAPIESEDANEYICPYCGTLFSNIEEVNQLN